MQVLFQILPKSQALELLEVKGDVQLTLQSLVFFSLNNILR